MYQSIKCILYVNDYIFSFDFLFLLDQSTVDRLLGHSSYVNFRPKNRGLIVDCRPNDHRTPKL